MTSEAKTYAALLWKDGMYILDNALKNGFTFWYITRQPGNRKQIKHPPLFLPFLQESVTIAF
jgi:hypothetical protein